MAGKVAGKVETMPLRVLWVIKGLGPGGAEHLLVNQARVRDTSRFDVSVAFAAGEKTALVPLLEAEGIAVHALGTGLWHRLISLRRLLADSDVVHVHSPLVASEIRLLRLTTRRRPKLVVTEHNSWDAFHPVTRTLNACTAWMDDARIAVSDAARNSMWRSLRSSTEVVSHGVDVASMREARSQAAVVRRALAVGDDRVLAVTVANFRVHKDYPNLLRSMAQVQQELGKGVVLAVVGQGPLESEVRQLRLDLGLEGVVEILGYRADARELIAAADMFVLSSRQEGRPVALMEALGAGVPVVVTRAGGMAEMVTDGAEGLVVPIGDSGALAAAMIRIATDREFRATCSVSAAESGGRFDITVAQRRLEQIYEAVIAGLKPTAHQ